jgi:hypothetical protein
VQQNDRMTGHSCARISVRVPHRHGEGRVPGDPLENFEAAAAHDELGREVVAEVMEGERGVERRVLDRALERRPEASRGPHATLMRLRHRRQMRPVGVAIGLWSRPRRGEPSVVRRS